MEAVRERKNHFFSRQGRSSRKTFLKLVLPLLFFEAVGSLALRYNLSLAYIFMTLVISVGLWLSFIPLMIRRFHDCGLSGKTIFIPLGFYVCQVLAGVANLLLDLNIINNFVTVLGYVVMVCGIILLVLSLFFLLLKGKPQPNRYGAPEALSIEEVRQINRLCGGIIGLSVVWAFIGYLLI